MVINSDIKVAYRGDGQTTVFPFGFDFIKGEYIHVAIYDEITGSVTILEDDYFVDTEAKNVIYPGWPPGQEPAESQRPPVLPETSILTVFRQTDIDQLTDLGEKFPLPQIEAMVDKLTEILQEQNEKFSRTLISEVGDPTTPAEKIEEMQGYVVESAANAKRAEDSAAHASDSANSAAYSADSAAAAADNAAGWADTAGISANAAEQSAISAKAYSAPDWNAGTAYVAGDVVSYIDGNSYRCIADCTGIVPTDTTYWTKITSYVGDDFWVLDASGYIVPNTTPTYSGRWVIDGSGYIVPINNVA
jgi:hypothetical protein